MLILICYLLWSIGFIVSMIGMYLVKDYQDGIIYKGFLGKIQNLIKNF
jgi:hypothetical protein